MGKKIKVEFEVDKNEVAIEAYTRIVQDMVEGFSIKKGPPLFPKITGDDEKDKKILEENKKEWKEFEKDLDIYREAIMLAFKKVKILKGELK